METSKILYTLKEAKAQILHMQSMINDIRKCDENLPSTDSALKILDRTINALTEKAKVVYK